MKPGRLHRRHLLRGAGGIAIGLPFLEAMSRPAAAAGAAPRRFVVFYTPNGTNDYSGGFVPSAEGTAYTFGRETEPLAPLRQQILFVSGLVMKTAQLGKGDLHTVGMSHLLTGIESVNPVTGPEAPYAFNLGGGISVDQEMARVIGAKTKFPSLELGVQNTLDNQAQGFTRMSYKGKKLPVPAEQDPRAVFKRLFADGVPGAGGAVVDLAHAQRRSVLDTVMDDFRRLEGRVGAQDRQKLDAHLAAVRGLELRLARPAAKPATALCTTPVEPRSSHLDRAKYPEIGRQHMDLLVMALACDLTRVATLQWSYARSIITHPWAGVDENHHDLSHKPASPKLSAVNRWYAQQLLHLATAMKGIAEADRTLLDNTVIYWGSEVSLGQTHSFDFVWAVLVGSCGGSFRTGQHVRLKGLAHSRLHVSFLQAMGVDAQTFGDPRFGTDPLPGLG